MTITNEQIAGWMDDLSSLRKNPLRVMAHTDLLSLLTELQAHRSKVTALEAFVSSFHVTVVDNVYKDVSLHLEQPHALSLRLTNSSDKSWIYADFEERRRAALAAGGRK